MKTHASHPQTNRVNGFTLIELMLAMAFFASILIVSTVVIIQIFSVYNKGIVVKQINGLGRRITDDTIRVGNSAVGNVSLGGYNNDGTHPRCLGLGGNIYVWSYETDTTANPRAYRTTGASPDVVRFSRLNGATACPASGVTIANTNLEALLGDNVRVYDATINTIGDKDDLLRFKMVLGSYSGPGSQSNPVIDAGGKVTCQAGFLGDFCAFGTYDTVIYLPNK